LKDAHPKIYDNLSVVKIDPKSNIIYLSNGDEINYKYLIIATGLNED